MVLFLVSSAHAQQPYLNGLPVIVARLERHHVYEASIFEDSVSNVLLNGVPKQSFYIRPLEGATVDSAQMEMVTPYPNEVQYFPSIEWDPGDGFTVEGPVEGLYSYLWEFGPISNQAAVWIQTNFTEEFQLPFACHRTWNPWITLENVTQTLTVIFEPSKVGGVHIHVREESTDEASFTILSASSTTWPGSFWFDEENGNLGANWGGDCGIGTYIFYIEIEVENKKFPDPIYYKPSVGLSLSLDTTPDEVVITEDHVTIWDDVDGDGVATVDERFTYSVTGDDNWQVIMKDDYDVILPSYSRVVPFMAEGKAFVKLEEEFVRGSAFLVSGPTPPIPKYVYLNADGQGFWWETTEISVQGNMIKLKGEPTTATTGNPGPAPIVVRIPIPEEGRRVTASGPGVSFTGQITKIETPP